MHSTTPNLEIHTRSHSSCFGELVCAAAAASAAAAAAAAAAGDHFDYSAATKAHEVASAVHTGSLAH